MVFFKGRSNLITRNSDWPMLFDVIRPKGISVKGLWKFDRGVISEKFARLLDEQPGSNDRAKRQKREEGED